MTSCSKQTSQDYSGLLFSIRLYFLFNEIHSGKSFSEDLILESVDPHYDERLFIEFSEKYKFTTNRSQHVVYNNCFFVFFF